MASPWQIHAAIAAHTPGPWTQLALCAQANPEDFFPEAGQSSNNAKSICRNCEVRPECLNYAINSPIPLHGVWGGCTPRERRDLRRKTA